VISAGAGRKRDQTTFNVVSQETGMDVHLPDVAKKSIQDPDDSNPDALAKREMKTLHRICLPSDRLFFCIILRLLGGEV